METSTGYGDWQDSHGEDGQWYFLGKLFDRPIVLRRHQLKSKEIVGSEQRENAMKQAVKYDYDYERVLHSGVFITLRIGKFRAPW
jgi:c-di-GMP-related signal transduction protein